MEFIYFAGIIQAWFAALLVNRKPEKGPSDKVLIIWLGIIGAEMLISLLNLRLLVWLPDLVIIPLLYGPLLYIYTSVLVSKTHTFPTKYYYHFIPFTVFAAIPFLWSGEINVDTINFWSEGGITILSICNYTTFLISTIYYVLIVFKKITNHHLEITNHFSYDSKEIRLAWIKKVSIWFIGSFILALIVYVVFLLLNIYPFNPIIVFHIGIFVFIFSISYFGIYQTQLFRPAKGRGQKKAIERKSTDNDSFENILQDLKNYMIENKPFLDSELTIQDLADDMEINVSEVSLALNHGINKNFFTYINEFRVEEAKSRILDPKNNHLTLLAIGYDSGFNSKSSFNALFKKHTGLTPSQFKKQVD